MIIFDLDGTLANCEHRRHFVDPIKAGCIQWINNETGKIRYGTGYDNGVFQEWKPDWKSFYKACDQDELIIPVAEIYDKLFKENDYYKDFEIWSERCESVRKKTEKWLDRHEIRYSKLKMRPIGDNTPDDQLKEKWLDDYIDSMGNQYSHDIECVFDDRPKVIRMWRRRGIFVFNCCQHDEEF
jgi:hypothetical protein